MSRRALADLAIVISLWACADRGVDPMFGANGADPRKSERKRRSQAAGSVRKTGRANGRRH